MNPIFNILTVTWLVFFVLVILINQRKKQGQQVPISLHFVMGLIQGVMVVVYGFNLVTNGDIANGSATLFAFLTFYLYQVSIPRHERAGNASVVKRDTIAMWWLAGMSFLVQVVHLVIRNLLPLFAGGGYPY